MQFDLSFERNEVYECGAALLTVLANPKEIDGARSLELYLSLCGGALWLRHSLNPEDEAPITVKPKYVFRDRKINDRHVGFVARRLGERMRVGYGRPPLMTRFRPGQSGNPRGRPKGARNLSTVVAAALSERVAVNKTADAGASPSSRRRSSNWSIAPPRARCARPSCSWRSCRPTRRGPPSKTPIDRATPMRS
jgi:uncharacterized protein DUF5681